MMAMVSLLEPPMSPPAPAAASPTAGRGPAATPAPAAIPAPETLHPALWLGHQLGRSCDRAVATGFPALDAQLPGGGWPRRVLTELLQPHAGIGEIRLLAATLCAVQQA